jgi:hypothetical protein
MQVTPSDENRATKRHRLLWCALLFAFVLGIVVAIAIESRIYGLYRGGPPAGAAR